jgi:hypothetical protein
LHKSIIVLVLYPLNTVLFFLRKFGGLFGNEAQRIKNLVDFLQKCFIFFDPLLFIFFRF